MALHLIVERENEIKAFKSEEYWTLDAIVSKKQKKFTASLSKVDGKKCELKNLEQTQQIYRKMRQ